MYYSSINKNLNVGYGRGFNLSVHEKIEEFSYDDKNYLRLIDGTGYEEYFYYNEVNEKFYSEQGDLAEISYKVLSF